MDSGMTVKINPKELTEYIANIESRKTCSEKATELFETRGKDFCVGLILHLVMYVSGSYEGIKNA
ncbi:hypothetical protein MCJ35_31120 [Enterocloster sp. OA13]|uniref:hypothetical protein n=1 Tax=Enterocloster sp. OA13 TaxID=2914161 RepID=UPI00047237A1|nr:hypothetical protein [Enterocloster sp. OA13]